MVYAPFTHVIPPYLHLILGLVNDVVKEMLADLTKLGRLNPLAAQRQRERATMLEELEGGIGVAVGELVDLLGPTERRIVRDMVAKMDKTEATVAEAARLAAGDDDEAAPVPAGGGVAAADSGERGRARLAESVAAQGAGAGYVVAGEIAAADWGPLLIAAREAAAGALAAAGETAADWRAWNKAADDNPRRVAAT